LPLEVKQAAEQHAGSVQLVDQGRNVKNLPGLGLVGVLVVILVVFVFVPLEIVVPVVDVVVLELQRRAV
jgi:hypothetical protein